LQLLNAAAQYIVIAIIR